MYPLHDTSYMLPTKYCLSSPLNNCQFEGSDQIFSHSDTLYIYFRDETMCAESGKAGEGEVIRASVTKNSHVYRSLGFLEH